jgi:cytoskeletal protein RodZ
MNKKVSNQLEKIIISVMIFLVLTAALFIFTSCKSDYQKALEGDTNTTDQTASSEKETAAATSAIGTEATGATETTSEPTNPEAQQIVEVTASSGGYSPRKIETKAGIPTILVMKSEGVYGCERAFNIPDLNLSEILPENGQTKFDLGTQAKGTKLLGVCSMGMYYFQIFFN